MSESWEYDLFISSNFQQYEINKECLARFKGESNRNINEDFTISLKDAICITLSNKIVIVNQDNA